MEHPPVWLDVPVTEPESLSPRGPLARLRLALLLAVAMAAAAVPVGVIWWAIAPHVAVKVTDSGYSVASFPDKGFVAADGWFLLVTGVAGLACGAVAHRWARRYPVVVPVVLAAGGVGAAAVAAQIGGWIGAGAFRTAVHHRPAGTLLHAPVQLGAEGALVAWGVGALLAYLAVAAWHWADGQAAGRLRPTVPQEQPDRAPPDATAQ